MTPPEPYYQRWQELAGLWKEAFSEAPAVRFAIEEAVDALEVYSNLQWLAGEVYDQDAQDAIDAAEEFFRGASVGMGG